VDRKPSRFRDHHWRGFEGGKFDLWHNQSVLVDGISDEDISNKVSEELTKINKEAKEKGANLTSKRSQKTGF
jgi:hypothetical protein